MNRFDQPFSAARLEEDLQNYCAFGLHRAGSKADRATCDWLTARLDGLGYELEKRPLQVDNYDALESTLTLGGREISLAAQPPFVESYLSHVQGHLVYCGPAGLRDRAENKIIVADAAYGRASSYASPAYRTLADLAIEARAQALILITNGPSSEATWLNIEPGETYPLTALCAPKQAAALREAARRAEHGSLQTPTRQSQRTAHSIVARRGRGPRQIVISTPVSGWTSCGAERGPGIATMLALATWLAAIDHEHAVTLLFTNGHELGDLGMQDILQNAAPQLNKKDVWIHLGAGFAARDWYELPTGLAPMLSADPQRFLLSSDPLADTLRDKFRGLPGLEQVYPLLPETSAGELRLIAQAGYENAMGMFGAHRFHHTLLDGPDMVSGELVRPVALAVREVIANLSTALQ